MRLPPAASTAVGIGVPALAAAASWSSLLLVVQGRVVPGWGVSAVLVVMSLMLRSALTQAERRASSSSPRSSREAAREAASWTRLGSSLLIVTAVLGTTWGAVDDLISGAEYHVLRPAGPEGCTAVVRETSFLVIGNGEAYAVGVTGLALGESGSWVVDDGYRPFAAGTYELNWGRDGGLLRVSGTGTDPVVSGWLTEIGCGW
ncbi:hypothetical protein [Streptomyces xinghaiensis]|uniref:hypothetical protein n=1 Tax=Streptomyces xinghaiensis TaxID=1038928 RepID=UPI002E0D10A8|nr:hypothetical protein OG463_11810 [Streptomyces xinghaiensis]